MYTRYLHDLNYCAGGGSSSSTGLTVGVVVVILCCVCFCCGGCCCGGHSYNRTQRSRARTVPVHVATVTTVATATPQTRTSSQVADYSDKLQRAKADYPPPYTPTVVSPPPWFQVSLCITQSVHMCRVMARVCY